MKSICLYFQVHQPFRLRTYRFFDIGEKHNYFDGYVNKTIVHRVAEKCYLPANKLMLELIKEYGSAFKISYSISGVALEQFRKYSPEVIESFQKLADTGYVEFLAETYSHSFASLNDENEFRRQVMQHVDTITELFGKRPTTFRNSELIYSDRIGHMVSQMGFNTMLTEGAKQILGWKSPNFLYCSALDPKLKLLLKNYQLSDDIAFRFSQRSWKEWPLTAEKYTKWLSASDPNQEVINLFMNYETFGEHQWAETGIFNFMKALPKQVFATGKFTFNTPSELSKSLQPISAISVEDPISWADEERDLTAWLGNDLQNEAFSSLYSAAERMGNCTDPDLLRDWNYLQSSDHFYYMSTKWFSDGGMLHSYYNAYDTPYEAFINYMNVVSDFLIRVGDLPGNAPESSNVPETVTKMIEIPAKTAPSTKATKKVLLPGEMLRDLAANDIRAIARKIGIPALALALWNDSTLDIGTLQQALNKSSLGTFRNLLSPPVAPHKTDIAKARKLLLNEVLKLKSA